jgi:hypothetical protein
MAIGSGRRPEAGFFNLSSGIGADYALSTAGDKREVGGGGMRGAGQI